MSANAVFGAALLAILGCIAWIDWRRLVIPDALNIGLAGAGLAFQAATAPASLWLHVLVGLSLLLAFWAVRQVHAGLTGRIGLGFGDVKMAGAAAVWLQPENLPAFIFCASLAGILATLLRQLSSGRAAWNARQPFGPFLAAGLAVTWAGDLRLGLPF